MIFSCQHLVFLKNTQGYHIKIELYDARWSGSVTDEIQVGQYHLYGKRFEKNFENLLETPIPKEFLEKKGILVLGKRPRICLFEEGEYQIVAKVRFQSPGRFPPFFWSNLLSMGVARDDPSSVLTPWERRASLRFSGAVGRARINVGTERELAAIPVEVFCQKLDWEGDLVRLLEDLSQIAASLALRPKGSTTLSLLPHKNPASPLERLVLLSALFSPKWLPKAFLRIKQFAEQGTHRSARLISSHQSALLRADDLIQALARYGGILGKRTKNLPEKLQAQTRSITKNIPENRAVLSFWNQIQREITTLQSMFAGDETLLLQINTLQKKARSLPKPFTKEEQKTLIGPVPKTSSLLFRKKSGYREIYLAKRLLRAATRADHTRETLIEAPGRTMPFLYEVWCFLVLARCLRALGTDTKFRPKTYLSKQGVIRLLSGKMQTLSPGIQIGYQMQFVPRSFISSYSVPLRPDFFVDLFGTRLVFDAKYRLEAKDGTLRHEDLLLAHAYKDALRMDGSFLLYPGKHDIRLFHQNPPDFLPAVGSFPLRPGKKAMAEGEEALGTFFRQCLRKTSLKKPLLQAAESRNSYEKKGGDV